jgi:hypothetical protein
VELYFHSLNISSWHGVQLKSTGTFFFTTEKGVFLSIPTELSECAHLKELTPLNI